MEKINILEFIRCSEKIMEIAIVDKALPLRVPYHVYIGTSKINNEYTLVTEDGRVCEKGDDHMALYKKALRRLIDDGILFFPEVISLEVRSGDSLDKLLECLHIKELGWKK